MDAGQLLPSLTRGGIGMEHMYASQSKECDDMLDQEVAQTGCCVFAHRCPELGSEQSWFWDSSIGLGGLTDASGVVCHMRSFERD